jgi:two-component system OmpR family sensor kinase
LIRSAGYILSKKPLSQAPPRLLMRPLPSLRLWLLSTSVLSVIAGYALLFALQTTISNKRRLSSHQQLVEAVVRRPDAPAPLGVELSPLPDGQELPPLLQSDPDGEAWISSVVAVSRAEGGSQLLLVRQNVTDSLTAERFSQLLLIAAAGLSTLLTSLLLRLVLWRGLVRPLKDLSLELDGLTADSLGEHLLPVETQARELQPIALAFNRLQQRLEAAWLRERRFVDGVAHELRTPITLISGRSQRLLRASHPEPMHESLRQIQEEAGRMASLIRALLELARNDSQRLNLVLAPIDAEQLLLEAFECLLPSAPDRLQLGLPPEEPPPPIEADAERLQECLAALVENALLYSDGPVQLWLGCSRETGGQQLVLHVSDHGPGIPLEERSRVLERFARGSTSSGTRGSGIGLAMVQELSAAMGAELRIRDRLDAATGVAAGADLQLCFRV